MKRFARVTVLSLIFTTCGSFAADTLVVCPPSLRKGLKKWVEYRRKQGHEIKWIDNDGDSIAIRRRIRDAVNPKETKFVVMVGDANRPADGKEKPDKNFVATHYIPAKVNIHWGKERDIATDNYYADLDDDHLPDLAIGRIPADSVEDLETITDKIIAYEENEDYGEWRRRISFVGCPGNFGAVIDSVIEQGSRRLTTEGIPPAYCTTATYGNWRSPYCPDPRRFRDTAVGRLNEGALFWVYIGHGHNLYVDQVETPDQKKYPILTTKDVPDLKCGSGHPIAIFLACYTGRFDAPVDCLSEEMLRSPGGPVAIYSATRVTMPYAMTVMGGEMMKAYFVEKVPTIGELVLHAKRQMVLADRSTGTAKSLDTLALTLNKLSPDLKAERLEHVQMYELFGDPLLKLSHPNDVVVDPLSTAKAGDKLIIKGTSPLSGKCVVELVSPRDKLHFTPPLRKDFSPVEAVFTEIQETYEKANQPVLASKALEVKRGTFEAELTIPESMKGKGHIRVYVHGAKGYALGNADFEITSSGQSEKVAKGKGG